MPLNCGAFSKGLLVEGDLVSLPTDLAIKEPFLCDQATGAKHRLHPLAVQALTSLSQGPVAVEEWIGEMRGKGLKKSEITEIISFLNMIGGLQVKRHLRSSWQFLIMQMNGLLFGMWPVATARRLPATLKGVGLAVAYALAPVLTLSIPVAVLAYEAGIIAYRQFLYEVPFVLFLTYLSTVAHEAAHVLVLRLFSFQPIVMQRGMRVAVLHPPLSAGRGVFVALSGPLSGALAALVLCYVAAGYSRREELIYCGAVVAFFHCLSLVPLYGDGRALLKLFKIA